MRCWKISNNMKKKRTTIQYARALYEITTDLKGKDLSAVVHGFVSMLARDHKLKQAHRILSVFMEYAKERAGEMPLTVTSARDLSDRELVKIGNIFSKHAEVTPLVDKNMIGGVIVRTKDKIFDASIRTQLARLKKQLT